MQRLAESDQLDQPDRREQRGGNNSSSSSAFFVVKWLWIGVVSAMLVYNTIAWSVALSEYRELRPQIASSLDDFQAAINHTESILPVLKSVDWTALETSADQLVNISARVNNVLGQVDYLIGSLDILRQMFPQYFPAAGNSTG